MATGEQSFFSAGLGVSGRQLEGSGGPEAEAEKGFPGKGMVDIPRDGQRPLKVALRQLIRAGRAERAVGGHEKAPREVL